MVLMIALVPQKKNNFTKVFCLSLHNDDNESCLYVSNAEICKFKANDNISWYNFCLGYISVDHSSTIHQYLMVENTIKCLVFLKNIYGVIIN